MSVVGAPTALCVCFKIIIQKGLTQSQQPWHKTSQSHLGTQKYKHIWFLEAGNSDVQGKAINLLSSGAVTSSGEHPFDLYCVYSIEKLELVAQGAGSARAASVWHNQLHCSRRGHGLFEACCCTAKGQQHSPAGTHKFTREVSAEVGVNTASLRWDQGDKFALLLSKEILKGSYTSFSAAG